MPHNRKQSRTKTEDGLRIERAMASVHASIAVEGLKPSKACVAFGKQYLEGEIPGHEAITRVKAIIALIRELAVVKTRFRI